MINFDECTNENKINHNPNWPYIPDYPYRILIVSGSESGKTNTLLNLINNQPDIHKIYLYAKDPYEDKYQILIKKRESVGLKHFIDPKAFIEYSNDMHDVYENINDYNPDKENKISIVFDDMIADMIDNKKLNSIVTELFIRDVRLNTTHFFIMKIPNKRELQQIAIDHSSNINTKVFIKIYNKCTDEPYSFLVNNTTLSLDDPLRFRKNVYNM